MEGKKDYSGDKLFNNVYGEFDAEKDKLLFTAKCKKNKRNAQVEVNVYKYDTYEPKIHLRRFYIREGQKKYVKLGRLSLDEARETAEIIKSVLERIENNTLQKG